MESAATLGTQGGGDVVSREDSYNKLLRRAWPGRWGRPSSLLAGCIVWAWVGVGV